MRRRDFNAVLVSAAIVFSSGARGQSALRRVTVVLGFEQDDQEGQKRLTAFVEALGRLGWRDKSNIRLDVRWAGGNIANYKAVAREIAAASPDVVVAMTTFCRSTSTANKDDSDCIRTSLGFGRGGLCREHYATRRQHHGL
jgi:putative tryptophan/tyrosine transport system substrate-binding protein